MSFACHHRLGTCFTVRHLIRVSEPLSHGHSASIMTFIFLGFVLLTFVNGAFAQVPFYETTPFPPALTSFSCHGRPPGYFADFETGCKTYHVCDGNSHFTYICPTGTLFQQKERICDHEHLVRCEESFHFQEEDFYKGILRVSPFEEDRPEKGSGVINFVSGSSSPFEETSNQTEEFVPTETTHFAGEKSTEATPTTTIPTATQTAQFIHNSSHVDRETLPKFLKIRLKDFRSLFYIPELENNSLVVKAELEVIIPVEKTNLFAFKSRNEVSHSLNQCPSHCNPKFVSPGTCHPCIVIR